MTASTKFDSRGAPIESSAANRTITRMNPTSLDHEIQSRISTFASELSWLVKAAALESVHAALGGSAPAPAKRGRPKRSKNVAKRGPGRPANSSVDADKILAHVRANPGQRSDQIAADLGLAVKQIQPSIAKLLAAGSVRKEGIQRGTRYFAGGKATAPKAAKKKARRKLSPAAVANLRANLAKARAARAKKLAAKK